MNRFHVLLLLTAGAVGGLGPLSSAARADEPPQQPSKPSDPAPPDPKKPSDPKPSDPKPGDPPAPPKDPAPPGDPAKPAEPPAPAPGPTPPAETPEERDARLKKEAEEKAAADKKEQDELDREQKDAEARAKAAGPQEEPRDPPPEPPRPGPRGMCYVPEGDAVIGTSNQFLAELLGNRPADIRRLFDYERPQHKRRVREGWIDQNELTNAQYLVFLQDKVKAYVCDGRFPTLVEVAGHMLENPNPQEDDVTWRQLAEANKDSLMKALPDLAGAKEPWPLSVKNMVLPKKDLVLTFYSHRVPDDWPGIAPGPGRLNHPVRYISGLDLLAYAEWAGRHVPSEFEWEWAARGPKGSDFPWGKIWHKESTDWCNWGAKVLNPVTHEADTWEVGSHPLGRSWVGAHDMVGNVAEWTDSGFYLYPGASEKERAHDFLGATRLRIIRGGTAVDQEVLVLRPAARNFIGTGFNSGPPYLENRYAWVGGRTSWWSTPGANQAPYVAARINRGGRIRAATPNKYGEPTAPNDLDMDRLAGTVAENYAGPDEKVENGVWVKGRTRAVLTIPCRSILNNDADAAGQISFARAKSKDGLLKESESEMPMILFGAFHTDAKLTKVWKRAPTAPGDKDKGDKKRGRQEAPALVEAVCPPGSYILGLWHKRIVLLDSSRDFKYSLTPPDKAPSIEFKKVKAGTEVPPCKVQVDDQVNLINGVVSLPLAIGKGSDPELWVVITFSVDAAAEDVLDESKIPNGWR